jgi:hypothetical protein
MDGGYLSAAFLSNRICRKEKEALLKGVKTPFIPMVVVIFGFLKIVIGSSKDQRHHLLGPVQG